MYTIFTLGEVMRLNLSNLFVTSALATGLLASAMDEAAAYSLTTGKDTNYLVMDGQKLNKKTSVPIGADDRCKKYNECRDLAGLYSDFRVAGKPLPSLAEISRINVEVNHTIKPEEDIDHFGDNLTERWLAPADPMIIQLPNGKKTMAGLPRGDCEDYVLKKIDRLLEAGISPLDLMVAVVKQSNGAGHAILLMRYKQNILQLDNLRDDIRFQYETQGEYDYVKYSFADTKKWYKFESQPDAVAVMTPSP